MIQQYNSKCKNPSHILYSQREAAETVKCFLLQDGLLATKDLIFYYKIPCCLKSKLRSRFQCFLVLSMFIIMLLFAFVSNIMIYAPKILMKLYKILQYSN